MLMWSIDAAKASEDSTNTWNEEKRKGVHKVAGRIFLHGPWLCKGDWLAIYVYNVQLSITWWELNRNYKMGLALFYLQERLNQVLMEKKKESRSGMEIMNLLQVLIELVREFNFVHLLMVEWWFYLSNGFYDICKQKEGRQRGTWNGKKADNDFYKKIVRSVIELCENFVAMDELCLMICFWQVDAYEAKNQELMAENADLKALLRSMQVYVIQPTAFVILTIFCCSVSVCFVLVRTIWFHGHIQYI